MTLLHHPSEDLLLGAAAGRLGAGPSLLIEAHLHACPACRAQLADLEAVGGALLDSLPPAPMAEDALARALAGIERPAPPQQVNWPLGIDLEGLLKDLPLGRRRWLGPGMWMRPVLRDSAGVTYLLRSGPGRRLPRHAHTGSEYVCVIKGAFSDETGRYGPGDFAHSDDSLLHAPATDDEGECLCLISAEGPMRFQGPLLRALQPLLGV